MVTAYQGRDIVELRTKAKLKTFQERATWYILVVNYRVELKMITWEHFSPERRLA